MYLGLTIKEPEVGFIAAKTYVFIISFTIGICFEMSNQCEWSICYLNKAMAV